MITVRDNKFYRGEELLATFRKEGDVNTIDFTFNIGKDENNYPTHPDAIEIHGLADELSRK